MKDSVDLTTNRDFLHKAKDEVKGHRFGVLQIFILFLEIYFKE